MKTLFVVPRPRPPFLAVLLFALLASCGPLNRGLGGLSTTAGRGAVTGARDGLGTDTTKAALDGLIGAVTAGVGRGIGNDVSPEIRKLARGLFLSGEAFLGAAGDSIRGPLAASIDSLIVGRTALLGRSIDARIDPLLGRIGERARFEIDSTIAVVGASANRSLGPLADSMVDRVSRRLADNLDHKLGAAVERLVKRTGDSAGNAAGSILWKIALPVIGILVALAGVGVAWMWIDRKRRTESLTALAEAVRDIENPATRRMVKEKVKEKTRDRGVGGYFDTFLEKRELRIEKEKVPVPALVGGDGDGPVAPAGAP